MTNQDEADARGGISSKRMLMSCIGRVVDTKAWIKKIGVVARDIDGLQWNMSCLPR